ncbi:MAG: DsbA family protein [Gammaproteobacteria bacterium]|nr:DsbA family protein [Gammaproteobacteria bacterium]
MKLTLWLASAVIISSGIFSVSSYAGNDIDISGFDTAAPRNQSAAPIHNQDTAKKNINSLVNDENDNIRGNKNGQITLVEFMDFKCSYCKHMEPIVKSLINNNPNLRVVIKNYPVKGDISVYAAKAALAAKKQGKDIPLHDKLIEVSDLTQDQIMTIAKSLGINTAQLKTDMASSTINQQIQKNVSLAKKLQIFGTPAFFIVKTDGNGPIDFVMGAVDESNIQGSINKMMQ